MEETQRYPMSITVYKILFHKPVVIKSVLLPNVQHSKQALMSWNKLQERFTRKTSITKAMGDIFHHFLISSDSRISNKRKLVQKSYQND